MTRRKWSAEQKLAIIIQGLKANMSVSELCREHGISQVQYYKWRDQFLEGAKERLSGKRSKNGKPEQTKIKQLERIIGQQTVTIEKTYRCSDIRDMPPVSLFIRQYI